MVRSGAHCSMVAQRYCSVYESIAALAEITVTAQTNSVDNVAKTFLKNSKN